MSELTLLLNDKEFALSEAFKESIEKRAENEFSENFYVDYWWDENERGDPILNIETEGYWIPWDRLAHLEFEYEEVEQESDDSSEDGDSDEAEDLDNGNGVKSVPKEDVDMGEAGSGDEQGEEPEGNNKFMVTHPSKNYIPQPEAEDPDKVPPDPEELPEDPTLVAWIPEDGTTECWSAGKALIPQTVFLEWNVQIKADEAPDGATKIVPDSDGHVEEVQRTSNHDHWESLCEMHDCDVVSKKQQKQQPPENAKESYSGKEAEDTLDGKYGGDNFHV